MILFLLLLSVNSFELIKHPLEPRCAYISGLNIKEVIMSTDLCTDTQKASSDIYIRNTLNKLFDKYPLLIFKNTEQITPKEFITFLSIFDNGCDKEAIKHPEQTPTQILQPFDQIPGCNHVAPRGNFYKKNIFNINDLTVLPKEPFMSNYVWHVDLLGHESKLPNVVTGFNIIEQPLIGGETDFISGETVYENLPDDIKLASRNIVMKINRHHFALNYKLMDYSGTKRIKKQQIDLDNHTTMVPLVFAPESNTQLPRILMLPSFFEKVVGWDEEESQTWMSNYMQKYILPHRFSIQWKKGDIGVFNNRRFMHSSTPSNNYMKFTESSERLLLQTFLPTNKPIFAMKPFLDNDLLYNVGWCNNLEKSENITKGAITHALFSIINNKGVDNKYNLDETQYYMYTQKNKDSNAKF